MNEQHPGWTRLLGAIHDGDPDARERLVEEAYGQLKQLASRALAGQESGHTLQATALVNEAWLKLAGHLDTVKNRHHFFAVASQAMRQILHDHARARRAAKRGDGVRPLSLTVEVHSNDDGSAFDLLALDDALTRLGELNERHARLIELRYFGSLTLPETADVLGVSVSTVKADWAMARAWMRVELDPQF